MRRAVLLVCAFLGACKDCVGAASSDSTTTTEEPDDEPDSAPFAVVVRRGAGRVCGGALVSLRTVLTASECARSGADLSVLAPGAAPQEQAERRVARVALARAADGSAPALAVLELEAPFGEKAQARPILMATRSTECAAGATCHVVRAARALIVDAELVSVERCAAPSHALCLAGPTLCASDRGAGLVCGGKLCGVLGRAGPAADRRGDQCGDTHEAQSVALARRFLHCAHTLRACGRGGECAELCSERELRAPTPTWPLPPPANAPRATRTPAGRGTPTRSPPPPASTPPPDPALPPTHSSPPANFEFEPNRADFKAGEYGDNAADYSGEEGGAGGTTPPSEGPSPRAAPHAEPAVLRASRGPPPSPRDEPAPSPAERSAPRGHALSLFLYSSLLHTL